MVPLRPVNVLDRASVSVVREQVRAAARTAGFGTTEVEELALAASELAQNQLDHATDGVVEVATLARGPVPGVQLVARDAGQGLPVPGEAFAGVAVPRGLGAGLPTVRRLAGELDVDVRYGEGTTVTVRRFVRAVPRHPEVAVLGRGLEAPSGDHAWVSRHPDGLALAVLDGVGHGAPARDASDRAVAALSAAPDPRDPVALLRAAERALRGTRGAAMSVAWWDVAAATVTVAGVGNVALHVYDPTDGVRALLPTPGILGVRAVARIGSRALSCPPGAVLVVHTDGLSSSGDLRLPRSVQVRPPMLVADHLLAHEGKLHDDALVLVAR